MLKKKNWNDYREVILKSSVESKLTSTKYKRQQSHATTKNLIALENAYSELINLKYPQVLALAQKMINYTSSDRKSTKEWKKKFTSTYTKTGEVTPSIGVEVEAIKPTLICAVLAHTKGKLHFNKAGHWWWYNPECCTENTYLVPQDQQGFEWQALTIIEYLEKIRNGYLSGYSSTLLTLEEFVILEYLMANASEYKGK